MLSSCTGYNKVLNKGDVKTQYKLAQELFEQEKYSKAITLFEKVAPSFINKPQLQRLRYMNAIANYKMKDYEVASYHFNRFITNYPQSTKIEEVYYLNAQSLFKQSPRSSLDQEQYTMKALDALQTFLDRYPDSKYTKSVNNQYKELVSKLNKKAYDIAYLYYKTGRYKAAIVAFDNYISDYLGSKYKEDALFHKFKSAYFLGMKSIEYKKLKRLQDAKKAQKRYLKYYPDSKYTKESNDLLENINKEIEIINAQTTTEK